MGTRDGGILRSLRMATASAAEPGCEDVDARWDVVYYYYYYLFRTIVHKSVLNYTT